MILITVTETCSCSAKPSGCEGLRTPFSYTASTCIPMAPLYAFLRSMLNSAGKRKRIAKQTSLTLRFKPKTLVGAAGLEPATLCLEDGGCHISQVPYFQMLTISMRYRLRVEAC